MSIYTLFVLKEFSDFYYYRVYRSLIIKIMTTISSDSKCKLALYSPKINNFIKEGKQNCGEN